MGVMSCSRNNCESIMCDTYISNIGYVCDSCQREFEEKCPEKAPKSEMVLNLKKFMSTEKNYNFEQGNEEISASELFDSTSN